MSSQYSDYSVYSIYPPPAPPPPPPPPREREWMRNEEEEEEDDRPLVIDMGEEEEEEKEEEEGQEEEEEQAMDLRINRDPRGPNPSQPPQTLPPPAPYLGKISSRRKRDRGPKSWEFLMRLLADPRTNPDVIRWEDRSRYTFRLVQPQVIASLWGQRSNKRTLTYNNFARALRYHYHTKYLIRVSERQLVYGCGQPAIQFLNTILHQH
ncbi:hypothetical protein O3P69_019361 [Scylla paramamosain]|uniref:ETS domain-containing protein n=1 Tax=Scylla paramamosain TaxID=85552 RepID=A0AAW0SVG1_SCYPA